MEQTALAATMLFAAPASVWTSVWRRFGKGSLPGLGLSVSPALMLRRAKAVLRSATWQRTAGAMACPSQPMAGPPSLSSLCKLRLKFCKFRKAADRPRLSLMRQARPRHSDDELRCQVAAGTSWLGTCTTCFSCQEHGCKAVHLRGACDGMQLDGDFSEIPEESCAEPASFNELRMQAGMELSRCRIRTGCNAAAAATSRKQSRGARGKSACQQLIHVLKSVWARPASLSRLG